MELVVPEGLPDGAGLGLAVGHFAPPIEVGGYNSSDVGPCPRPHSAWRAAPYQETPLYPPFFLKHQVARQGGPKTLVKKNQAISPRLLYHSSSHQWYDVKVAGSLWRREGWAGKFD